MILFRCSSLGHIMVEPRSKSEGPISEGCKTHLIDKYVSEQFGRNTEIFSKYTDKGNEVEEDSLTLFSRVKGQFFKKNKEKVFNDFICGTPDFYEGPSLQKATVIRDLKSSWDIFTYFRAKHKDLNKLYYWQLQGYMDLTGAEVAYLNYCLIDTPQPLVNDEKRKLMWKMGATTDQDPNYIEACKEIDKLHTYSDIPMEDRMFEIRVDRNQADIDRMHQRVLDCREYMEKTFHKQLLIA